MGRKEESATLRPPAFLQERRKRVARNLLVPRRPPAHYTRPPRALPPLARPTSIQRLLSPVSNPGKY